MAPVDNAQYVSDKVSRETKEIQKITLLVLLFKKTKGYPYHHVCLDDRLQSESPLATDCSQIFRSNESTKTENVTFITHQESSHEWYH